jgi:diguanylate cyclase (GGDEF)-like protein/PAS domain S-box-containing protein
MKAIMEETRGTRIGMVTFFFGFIILCTGLCLYLATKMRKRKKIGVNEKRVFQLVENSKDIVYHYQVKPERKFLYLSPAIENFLGFGILAEAYRNPDVPYERIHPEDVDTFLKKIEGDLDYNQVVIQRWKDDKGRYRWFEEYATPIFNEQGDYVAIQGIIRNIDEALEQKKNLEYRITHDPLTTIYNRNFFQKKMDNYDNLIDSPVAIVLFNIDNMKAINNKYGHKNGDKVLQETARLLDQYFRPSALVSRIGGDEFSVILANKNQIEICYIIKDFLEEVNNFNSSRNIRINVSVGYAYKEHSIGKMEELFVKADKNLQKHKRAKQGSKIFC